MHELLSKVPLIGSLFLLLHQDFSLTLFSSPFLVGFVFYGLFCRQGMYVGSLPREYFSYLFLCFFLALTTPFFPSALCSRWSCFACKMVEIMVVIRHNSPPFVDIEIFIVLCYNSQKKDWMCVKCLKPKFC